MGNISIEKDDLIIRIKDFVNLDDGNYQVKIYKDKNGVVTKFSVMEELDLEFRRRLTDIMNILGFSPNVKGYIYLRRAVEECYKRPVTLKEVYPLLKAEFDTTQTAIEKAMRCAIETSFKNGNPKIQQRCFGYVISANTGKLSLTEFVNELVMFLKEERNFEDIV